MVWWLPFRFPFQLEPRGDRIIDSLSAVVYCTRKSCRRQQRWSWAASAAAQSSVVAVIMGHTYVAERVVTKLSDYRIRESRFRTGSFSFVPHPMPFTGGDRDPSSSASSVATTERQMEEIVSRGFRVENVEQLHRDLIGYVSLYFVVLWVPFPWNNGSAGGQLESRNRHP